MIGKLCRSTAAAALALLTALAPVAPVYGQAQESGAAQPAAGAPAQTPPPATAQPQSPSAPPAQPSPSTPFTIPKGRDFSHPKPIFPNFIGPYTSIRLDPQEYTNSPEIGQMVRDKKLQLTLRTAIELALANNTDITVQRYYSSIAQTDILRTRAGGTQRGVNIVAVPLAFADVPTLTFDPILTSSLSWDRRQTPVNNPLTSGVGTTTTSTTQSVVTNTALANFQYSQNLRTGTSFAVTYNNSRTSTTSPAVLFNPSVQSVGTFSFSQALLNGFGRFVNQRYYEVALITSKAVGYAFRQSLITDISGVENDYWELVYARGEVEVQQRAVDLAQRLYEDNQRQVQVGTLAPIEIVRAEAQLATAQQNLIAAQTYQLQQQSLLMSVIARDPIAQELRDVEIIPLDTVQPPPLIENLALVDAINEALQKRPDVLQAKTTIEGDNINVRTSRNALLPSLSLSGFVTSVGLGGNTKNRTTATTAGQAVVGANGTPVVITGANGESIPIFLPSTTTTVTGINEAGFGAANSSLFRFQNPEYQAQLALTIPIRNRVAQADNARAILAERQDQARLQQVVNGVAVDVQTTQIALQQDRAAVIAAQKARTLQEQTLQAEQTKLQLGASTIFLVVTAQQQLSAAAGVEVRATTNLLKAQVEFERAMGRTLDVHQITIAGAKSGTAPRDTLIPGTTVSGEIVGANEALPSLRNSPR